MLPQPNPNANSIFKWKNPNMGTAATMGANMIGTLGKQLAPDVYDPRIGMVKPNAVGTMTDFSLAGIGSTFGLPGLAIGAGADVLKNLYAVQQQNKQYNEAVNKADFYDNRDSRLQMMQPDYTQMMRYGGVMQYGMGGQVPASAMPNAKMEANELVLIPQQDGSYTEYMQTSPNAPSHEQGGVNAQLPAGAIVFPAEYVPQVKAALAAGDFAAISQIAQQMLQAGEQAKQQGQAFTSGAGGELPPAQQQQVQQQAQQMPQEQGMFPPMMRAGGIAKMLMYGGGGVVPDMMQSDDYATQKARMDEEERMRRMKGGAVDVMPLASPTNVQNPNPSAVTTPNVVQGDLDYTTENPKEAVQSYIQKQTGFDKNGNYTNYENNLDYYSQENKSKRNEEYKRQGKTNPDANDSQPTAEKNPQQIKPKPKAKPSATTETTTNANRQDRTTSRQQAMKAGVYEGSRWDEKTGQRMVKVNGKEEVFDPNKKYGKSETTTAPKETSKRVDREVADYGGEVVKPTKITAQAKPKAGENSVLAPAKNPADPMGKPFTNEAKKVKASNNVELPAKNPAALPMAEKKDVITDKDRADIGGMVRQKLQGDKLMEQRVAKMGNNELYKVSDRMKSIADGMVKENDVTNGDYGYLDEYYREVLGNKGQIPYGQIASIAKQYYADLQKNMNKYDR